MDFAGLDGYFLGGTFDQQLLIDRHGLTTHPEKTGFEGIRNLRVRVGRISDLPSLDEKGIFQGNPDGLTSRG